MRYESGRARTLHGAEYADAAYDTRGIYEASGARGTTVVIPPTRTAPCLEGDHDRPRATWRLGYDVAFIGRK
jgi:hypothetical protein